jgi:uncharacterized membrane protein HdeD (DUF308 family)
MAISFLLGMMSAFWFTAAMFFLRFWRQTRDFFFLPFAVFFIVEGVNRIVLLFSMHPNEGSPWIYVLRLLALLLIFFGIVYKNYGSRA